MNSAVVADRPVVSKTEHWLITRAPGLLVVVLHGEIDDVASDGWRAVCADNFATAGHPRFAFVDTSRALGVATLPARMRSAGFLRTSARQMESVALVAGVQTTFLIKTVMRVAGLQNVHLVDDSHAAAVLARFEAGVDAFAPAAAAAAD